MREAYWQRDQAAVRISRLPANAPTPVGMPEVVIAPVAYPEFFGADDTAGAFSRRDWVYVGVAGALLAGLGLILVRSS
jgi:hypothetical protein